MSDIEKIINKGIKFYNESKKDENGRCKSWEYCYKIFHDAHIADEVNDEFMDYLSLHLSFYLASWGMYRGSSFLLQKDYKIHKPVIKELLKDEYNSFWGIKIDDFKDMQNQKKFEDLVTALKGIYDEIRFEVKQSTTKNEVSDLLVSKVLMGTLGCVPAYDSYFVSAIKKEGVASGCFNIKSILKLVDFYNKYSNEFENARSQMKVNGMEYPQMKLLDSCFWQMGYDDNNK